VGIPPITLLKRPQLFQLRLSRSVSDSVSALEAVETCAARRVWRLRWKLAWRLMYEASTRSSAYWSRPNGSRPH